MQSVDLYATSVLVFQRYLTRLAALLDRAERHCDADPAQCDALLEARLAPDMLPLRVQMEVVSNFALRAACPLAGLAVPNYGVFPGDFAGLRARLARAQQLLEGLRLSLSSGQRRAASAIARARRT